MYLRLLKKFGVFRVLLLILLLTDLASAGLTAVFLLAVQGYVNTAEIAAAVLLPTVIASFFVYTSLRNMLQLHEAESSLQKKNEALRKAAQEIEQLGELLPICSSCKKIRDDKGYWNQLEVYITTHSDVRFSHGLCPDCVKEYFPGQKVSDSGSIL